MKSLNLKKGSEVIIPAFSIISTALCVIKLGLKPILVDCDIHEWNTKSEDIIWQNRLYSRAVFIYMFLGVIISIGYLLFKDTLNEIVQKIKKN